MEKKPAAKGFFEKQLANDGAREGPAADNENEKIPFKNAAFGVKVGRRRCYDIFLAIRCTAVQNGLTLAVCEESSFH